MKQQISTALGAATGAAVLALTLAACGAEPPQGTGPESTAPSTATSAAEFTTADVEFAQMMIVHHREALDMAALAPDRTTTAQVLELADRILAAQEPEIRLMSSWLEDWGAEVPAAGEEMAPMGHGGDLPGDMTDAQLANLAESEGIEFDREFLDLMIEHHSGAVTMAQEYLLGGEFPASLDLAERIEATQTQEIEEMRALLAY